MTGGMVPNRLVVCRESLSLPGVLLVLLLLVLLLLLPFLTVSSPRPSYSFFSFCFFFFNCHYLKYNIVFGKHVRSFFKKYQQFFRCLQVTVQHEICSEASVSSQNIDAGGLVLQQEMRHYRFNYKFMFNLYKRLLLLKLEAVL